MEAHIDSYVLNHYLPDSTYDPNGQAGRWRGVPMFGVIYCFGRSSSDSGPREVGKFIIVNTEWYYNESVHDVRDEGTDDEEFEIFIPLNRLDEIIRTLRYERPLIVDVVGSSHSSRGRAILRTIKEGVGEQERFHAP